MQKKIFYNFLFIFLITTSSLANEIIAGYPKVIDGDTIHINASKIRLNGIDAPEREQICSKFNTEYNCGITATQALTEKINNQIVSCKLQSSKDRYGRYIDVDVEVLLHACQVKPVGAQGLVNPGCKQHQIEPPLRLHNVLHRVLQCGQVGHV